MTGSVAEARVRDELERILNRPEFSGEKSWLEELIEAVSSWFAGSVDAEASGELALGITLALVVVALVWLAIRVGQRGRAYAAGDGRLGGDPERDRVTELVAGARAARRAGDLRRALRLYWYALVYGLGQAGNLAYRDAWTNRELLERGRPDEATRQLLEPLLVDLEAREFGRVPATEDDVQRLAQLCESALGTGAG